MLEKLKSLLTEVLPANHAAQRKTTKPERLIDTISGHINAMAEGRFGKDTKWIYLDREPLLRFLKDEPIVIRIEGGPKCFVETYGGYPIGIKTEKEMNGTKEEKAKKAEASFFNAEKWLEGNRADLMKAAMQGKKNGYTSFSYPADGVSEELRADAAKEIAKECKFYGGEVRRSKFLFQLTNVAGKPESNAKQETKTREKKPAKVLKKAALNWVEDNKDYILTEYQRALQRGSKSFSLKCNSEEDVCFYIAETLYEENDFFVKVYAKGHRVFIRLDETCFDTDTEIDTTTKPDSDIFSDITPEEE